MTENPETAGEPIPPKLDLRKRGILRPQEASAAPAAAPAAPQAAAPVAPSAAPAADRKPAAPLSGPRPAFGPKPPSQPAIRIEGMSAAAPAAESAKRETSKISLDAARVPVAAPGGPKTIRIKPGGAMPTVKPPPAEPAAKVVTPAVDADRLVAAKRTTSRISLDAVLGAPEAVPEQPGGPKTIKLKKPGEPSAVKPPVAAAAAVAAPSAADASAATTQKKTVRIKRPGETPEQPAIPARMDEPAAAEAVRARSSHEPHFFFPLCAVLSMFVFFVLIYVLLAQCIGPDASLTQLSMGAPDANLPWPGKIMGH